MHRGVVRFFDLDGVAISSYCKVTECRTGGIQQVLTVVDFVQRIGEIQRPGPHFQT